MPSAKKNKKAGQSNLARARAARLGNAQTAVTGSQPVASPTKLPAALKCTENIENLVCFLAF